jgi:peptide deformylase
MILPIQVGTNNHILRQKAEEVKEITAEIKRLVLDMTKTMEKANGVGLAANQVGKSLRIILIDIPSSRTKEKSYRFSLVNPEIVKTSRKKTMLEEGCLSLPGFYALVERPKKITVKGLNINGEPIKFKANGLLAKVIQHEIDHLDGVLIIDRIK